MLSIECLMNVYSWGAVVADQVVPPWALLLLCLSKRVHSIFLLRLFNDGPAMLLAHAGAAALLSRRPRFAVLLFSAATSIKMNVLLMAPSVLVILLKARSVNVYGACDAEFSGVVYCCRAPARATDRPLKRI